MTMNVGDILYSSWGWEQTNISFYKVVKRTPKQVQLQKIGTVHEQSDTLAMQGTATPNEDVERGDPFRRKVIESSYGDGEFVMIESYESARKWDGKPKNFTAYA